MTLSVDAARAGTGGVDAARKREADRESSGVLRATGKLDADEVFAALAAEAGACEDSGEPRRERSIR